MKRIGLFLLCLCAAARAASRSPRRQLPPPGGAEPPSQPSLVRTLLVSSLTLLLDALLLGAAALLLASRLENRRSISRPAKHLLGAGSENHPDAVALQPSQPASYSAPPQIAVAAPRSTPLRPFVPSPRFHALREIFAEGLPDLRSIGRRSSVSGQQFMPTVLDRQPAEPPPAPAPEPGSALNVPPPPTAPLPLPPVSCPTLGSPESLDASAPPDFSPPKLPQAWLRASRRANQPQGSS